MCVWKQSFVLNKFNNLCKFCLCHKSTLCIWKKMRCDDDACSISCICIIKFSLLVINRFFFDFFFFKTKHINDIWVIWNKFTCVSARARRKNKHKRSFRSHIIKHENQLKRFLLYAPSLLTRVVKTHRARIYEKIKRRRGEESDFTWHALFLVPYHIRNPHIYVCEEYLVVFVCIIKCKQTTCDFDIVSIN